MLFSDSGTKSIYTSVGTHMLLVITLHLLTKVLWNISFNKWNQGFFHRLYFSVCGTLLGYEADWDMHPIEPYSWMMLYSVFCGMSWATLAGYSIVIAVFFVFVFVLFCFFLRRVHRLYFSVCGTLLGYEADRDMHLIEPYSWMMLYSVFCGMSWATLAGYSIVVAVFLFLFLFLFCFVFWGGFIVCTFLYVVHF